jgi:hypothetical protein
MHIGEACNLAEAFCENKSVLSLGLASNQIGDNEMLNTVKPDFTTGGEGIVIYKYIYIYKYIHTYIYMNIEIVMHICTLLGGSDVNAGESKLVKLFRNICKYVYIYIHTNIYIYIYIYTYIFIYSYTYKYCEYTDN